MATDSLTKLCSFIAEHTGYANVDPTCRIDQLVDDSLEFLEMMVDVQGQFSRLIPDSEYGNIKTVADLGRILFAVHN